MFLETKANGEIKSVDKSISTPPLPWQLALLEAADIMEKRGHCKGVLTNEAGNVCFLGALAAIPELPFRFWFEIEQICATAFHLFTGTDSVIFNDTHTGPEVIAAMRACAHSKLGDRYHG